MKEGFSIALIFLASVIILFAQISSQGQQKCALQIAGYVDDDPEGVVGFNYIRRQGNLEGISAYALEWDTKFRYNSVPTGAVRFFGDIPEGNYRIVVSKPAYKTSIYGLHLSCSNAINGIVSQSIRLWTGIPSQIVNNAKTTPSRIKEMRLNTLTVLGDVDTGEISSPPQRTYKAPPKTISGGVLNGKAISLPTPEYPSAARAVRASGAVMVQVLIDVDGRVISAAVAGGHPLLQAAAVEAARQAKFSPTLLAGQPVRVSGVITYNFVP